MKNERSGRGPMNAHVAPDHVDELRNLVDARLAHESPDARDAGIVLARERRPALLGVLHHRPELVYRERPAGIDLLPAVGASRGDARIDRSAPRAPFVSSSVEPDSLLLEEDRPRGIEVNRQSRDQHDGKGEGHAAEATTMSKMRFAIRALPILFAASYWMTSAWLAISSASGSERPSKPK